MRLILDRELFEDWYFPAIFPAVLLVIKYFVLVIAGAFSAKNLVPDICYIPIIFEVWALSSYKENNLKVERKKKAGARVRVPMNLLSPKILLLFLGLHSALYLFSVIAWMTERDLQIVWQFLSAFSVFFSIWFVLLLLKMEDVARES